MSILSCDGKEGLPPGFLELPALVYQDDPIWIPEDSEQVTAAFTPSNDYFTHGEARAYCIPGKVRAVAFHEPDFRINNQKVAFFGYFESIGDTDANAALMQQIEAWAQERGARMLFGPIQWTTAHGYRLRLSAEPGALPFIGEPQNPPTYPAQLEALGLSVFRKYVTQLVPFERAKMGIQLIHPLRDALLAEGYRFEIPNSENWVRSMPKIYEMADAIFSQNFAYTKISYQTFAAIFTPMLLKRICPHSSLIVFAPNGDPVGFGLGYPMYGPLIVAGRGSKRIPIRDLDYAVHAPELAKLPMRGCIGKTLGVHPAHRRKGIMESMLLYSFENAHDRYDIWYGAMIREDNPSRKTFAFLQAGEREYALYAKPLEVRS